MASQRSSFHASDLARMRCLKTVALCATYKNACVCCRSLNFGVLRNLKKTCRFVSGISHITNSHAIRTRVLWYLVQAEEYVENNVFVNQKSQLKINNDKEITCDRIELVIVLWKMTMVERMNAGL